MAESQQGGKKTKRSTKNQPANKKYKESERWKTNKIKRIMNHLFQRVLLYCRRNSQGNDWRNFENRRDLKTNITKEVRPTIIGTTPRIWRKDDILNWAKYLNGEKHGF